MAGVYMYYDGIEGAVETSGLENWIELTSFGWGFDRERNQAMDGPAAWSRPPSVHEITVTKKSDKATPALIQAGLTRKVTSPVKFKFTSTAKDKVATYMAIEISGCVMSRFQVAATGDVPGEMLGLNFTKIAITFTPRDAGLVGSPATTSWDLTKQTA